MFKLFVTEFCDLNDNIIILIIIPLTIKKNYHKCMRIRVILLLFQVA